MRHSLDCLCSPVSRIGKNDTAEKKISPLRLSLRHTCERTCVMDARVTTINEYRED